MTDITDSSIIRRHIVAWDYVHRWLNEHDERFVDITVSTDIDGKRDFEVTFFPESDPDNQQVFSARSSTFAFAVEELISKGKLND